jgi:hypothetical protein
MPAHTETARHLGASTAAVTRMLERHEKYLVTFFLTGSL